VSPLSIDKHFDSVEGFSTRQCRDLFLTVLPFSDLKESRQLLGELISDLHEHGLGGNGGIYGKIISN
jgi:phospholipid/cholesterol/gamma-HCH transport system ATP-binding protein